jgi:hypothetical protein
MWGLLIGHDHLIYTEGVVISQQEAQPKRVLQVFHVKTHEPELSWALIGLGIDRETSLASFIKPEQASPTA